MDFYVAKLSLEVMNQLDMQEDQMSMPTTVCRIRLLLRKVSYADEMSSGEV
ncbi:unnamed protein product [Prunus armeniaca]